MREAMAWCLVSISEPDLHLFFPLFIASGCGDRLDRACDEVFPCGATSIPDAASSALTFSLFLAIASPFSPALAASTLARAELDDNFDVLSIMLPDAMMDVYTSLEECSAVSNQLVVYKWLRSGFAIDQSSGAKAPIQSRSDVYRHRRLRHQGQAGRGTSETLKMCVASRREALLLWQVVVEMAERFSRALVRTRIGDGLPRSCRNALLLVSGDQGAYFDLAFTHG